MHRRMAAGLANSQRRKRILIRTCITCAILAVFVDAVQVPTYQEAQEPDASPLETQDYGVEPPQTNDTDVSPKRVAKPPRIPPREEDTYQEFMDWCTQVLGIQTSLTIKDFEYPDFMRIRMATGDDDDDEDLCDPNEFPPISVRGLAATRDVQVGDVVISIPFHALLTIPTTIDHDPVLSGILGPSERSKFGWEDAYFETPLLTIAILYHKHLGKQSPMHYYIDLLETNSPQDSMPLLWDRRKLKRETTAGVRRIVRGIQSDVKEMYETVMLPLAQEHPAIFDNDDYSLQQFQWAFSMVNSRHWLLPIPDLAERHTRAIAEETEYGGYNEQVLPASQPTDEWVRERGEQDTDDVINASAERQSIDRDSHSFMAPMADLLNFGPPCTRGAYNDEKKSFELIATCPFLAGQEVTFWYSDDCDDVIIANYGFTHPMVPKCPSADHWMEKTELWKRRAESLETQLEESYKELGRMDVELEDLRLLLRKCECDGVALEPEPRPSDDTGEEKAPNAADEHGPTKLRRFRAPEEPIETADGLRGVRDGVHEENNEQHARHGVRKKWNYGSKSGNSSL